MLLTGKIHRGRSYLRRMSRSWKSILDSFRARYRRISVSRFSWRISGIPLLRLTNLPLSSTGEFTIFLRIQPQPEPDTAAKRREILSWGICQRIRPISGRKRGWARFNSFPRVQIFPDLDSSALSRDQKPGHSWRARPHGRNLTAGLQGPAPD